jgi:hypothetical protein
MNTTIQDEIRRCDREIAQIEVTLLAGHTDVAGLCLAFSDWSTEIRILNAELAGRQDTSEGKKSRRPDGQRLGTTGLLLPERVGSVPGVGLRTLDLEAHLLAQHPAKKSSDGMRLPARGFHELSECSAFLPPKQSENLRCLAALARRTGFFGPGGLGFLLRLSFATLGGCLALGRALPTGGPFLRRGPLRRDVRAPFRNGGGCVDFYVGHVMNTLSALTWRMTIHHFVRPKNQVKSMTHDNFLAHLRDRHLFAKSSCHPPGQDVTRHTNGGGRGSDVQNESLHVTTLAPSAKSRKFPSFFWAQFHRRRYT